MVSDSHDGDSLITLAWAMGTKWCDTLEIAESNLSRMTQSLRNTSRAEQTLDDDLVPLYGDRTTPTSRTHHASLPPVPSMVDYTDVPVQQQVSTTTSMFAPQDGSVQPEQMDTTQQPEFDFGMFFGPFDDDLDALLMSFAPDPNGLAHG